VGETCVVDRSWGGAGAWQRAAEGPESMFHRRGDEGSGMLATWPCLDI